MTPLAVFVAAMHLRAFLLASSDVTWSRTGSVSIAVSGMSRLHIASATLFMRITHNSHSFGIQWYGQHMSYRIDKACIFYTGWISNASWEVQHTAYILHIVYTLYRSTYILSYCPRTITAQAWPVGALSKILCEKCRTRTVLNPAFCSRGPRAATTHIFVAELQQRLGIAHAPDGSWSPLCDSVLDRHSRHARICAAGGRGPSATAARDVLATWASRAGFNSEWETTGLLLPQRPEEVSSTFHRPGDIYLPQDIFGFASRCPWQQFRIMPLSNTPTSTFLLLVQPTGKAFSPWLWALGK